MQEHVLRVCDNALFCDTSHLQPEKVTAVVDHCADKLLGDKSLSRTPLFEENLL